MFTENVRAGRTTSEIIFSNSLIQTKSQRRSNSFKVTQRFNVRVEARPEKYSVHLDRVQRRSQIKIKQFF